MFIRVHFLTERAGSKKSGSRENSLQVIGSTRVHTRRRKTAGKSTALLGDRGAALFFFDLIPGSLVHISVKTRKAMVIPSGIQGKTVQIRCGPAAVTGNESRKNHCHS